MGYISAKKCIICLEYLHMDIEENGDRVYICIKIANASFGFKISDMFRSQLLYKTVQTLKC